MSSVQAPSAPPVVRIRAADLTKHHMIRHSDWGWASVEDVANRTPEPTSVSVKVAGCDDEAEWVVFGRSERVIARRKTA